MIKGYVKKLIILVLLITAGILLQVAGLFDVEKMLPDNVSLAFDGLKIDLSA